MGTVFCSHYLLAYVSEGGLLLVKVGLDGYLVYHCSSKCSIMKKY